MKNNIPMCRKGQFEDDIGRLAVFFSSSDSDKVIGQTVMVDSDLIRDFAPSHEE